jgi:hypothetical protein
MCDLVSPDANGDLENLLAGYLARETRIRAGTTLFNCSEVECRRIGNHLNVVGALESASVLGIAVRLVMVTACGNVAPKSGLVVLR